MKDYYMIHKSINLNIDNYDILKKRILIRNIVDDNLKYHLIYKDKSYDVNGKIVSQNKIYAKIESVEDVKKNIGISRSNYFV